MTAEIFLTPEQICDLTGKKRKSAQTVALRRMGISHKLRADGFPIVLRNHVEKELGGVPNKTQEPKFGPIA